MDILTILAATLMTLGSVYLLMLVIFNAVVIYFFVKYWDVLEPYLALSFKALKKQMDEELKREAREAERKSKSSADNLATMSLVHTAPLCDCSECRDRDR